MLKSTFLHIPCVGPGTENKLWRQGIMTWDDFLQNQESIMLTEGRKRQIAHHVGVSKKCLEAGDHTFFSSNLPGNQHWRAYPEFKHKCAYVDIETTGLDKHNNSVTVAGIYNGKESKIFIKGINMDELQEEVSKYSYFVSFNGRCFDMPFLEQSLGIKFDGFHADLRFLLSSVGYGGGLKRIEKMLGIVRDDDIAEVDGFEAVRLWYRYKKGDEQALQTLIEYNKADIENLQRLMEIAFEKASSELMPR